MTEREIDVQDLHLGMYIARLDRPWSETPFALQGFQIRSERTIRRLQKYCHHVYIDLERSEEPTQRPNGPSHGTPAPDGVRRSTQRTQQAPLPKPQRTYENAVSVEEELEAAQEARAEAGSTLAEVMRDVKAGRKLNAAGVKAAVGKLTETVLRNPDALLWLRRLKDKDAYSYEHAMNVSVLAIALGRHLGLPPQDLQDLGIGALLFDVGKMRLPDELLLKPGRLTPDEHEVVQKHVEYSVAIMKATPGLSPRAIEMALTHHERFAGGGYPKGIAGAQIPLAGRIGGIVDTYDAITSDRPYAAAVSPHQAIRQLYDGCPDSFQEELVEVFIQCLGIYPTGSMVELSTGQVGIVIMQNRVRHLRPKVMLILDADKVAYRIAPVADLMHETATDDGLPLNILRALEPGAFGIRPDDYYLENAEQARVKSKPATKKTARVR